MIRLIRHCLYKNRETFLCSIMVFSEFNKTYLQLSSGYDMIPLIEKGVAAVGLRPGMRFGQRYILATARYQRMIFAI